MLYNDILITTPRGSQGPTRLCAAVSHPAAARFAKKAVLATVSASALMIALSMGASAQEEAEAQTAAASEAQTAAASSVPEVDEIIVTGSQIARRGYEAPTPLTVMTTQDLQTDAPTNISDFMTKLPSFANSATSRNSANSVSGGTGGQASLNLKGMGANRTLILLDGMRIAPSSSGNGGGSVDINGLPDALIERVEVVTGGASAVYGSDALIGAVNFVLDKKYTGFKGSITGGGTIYADDGQFNVNLTGGDSFANDRGHFLVSATLNHVEGIDHGYRREWIREGWDIITNPARTATNGLPFFTVAKNVGSGLYTEGGLIASGPLKGIDFGPGGTTQRMFNYGALSPGNATMIGGDWIQTIGSLNDAAEGWIISLDNRVWRKNLFNRVSYDVSDDVTVFAQYMWSSTLSESNAYPGTNSFTIQTGNPFIPANIQTEMTARGLTSITLGKWLSDQGPIKVSNTRDLRQYLVGAEGAFGAFDRDWSWNVAYNRSETRQRIRNFHMPNLVTLRRATDVVRSPTTGAPICRSTLTNPADGCIPYNPFGTGVNSPGAIEYALNGTSQLTQRIHQDQFSGTVRGEPVSTWAGPVSLATGISHMTQNIQGFSSRADTAIEFFAANFFPTNGKYSVTEGFIETVVPLAKDVAWARSLDLNAALRETSYSTSGLVTTWKVGATYDTPLSGLRFRANQSRDIRAPNLGELFSQGSSGQNSQQDPFNGNQTVTNVLSITRGNPNLKPEKANSTGVGAVYQPEWVPGLSFSMDYYRTKVSGAIASVNATNTLSECFEGVQVYCNNIVRDANGVLRIIYISPANTAFVKTSGIDFEVSYRKNLADISDSLKGALSIHAMATNTIDLTQISPIGFAEQRAGVNASGGVPSWRYRVNVTYDINDYSISWTGRGASAGILSSLYTECTSACPNLVAPYRTVDNNHQPAAFYMDAAFVKRFESASFGSMDFFLNVENIMNDTPDVFINLTSGNGVYDKLGTVFRGGVRFKM